MPGKKSALNPASATSEDDRGRKTWNNAAFSSMAENRLKKYVGDIEIFCLSKYLEISKK